MNKHQDKVYHGLPIDSSAPMASCGKAFRVVPETAAPAATLDLWSRNTRVKYSLSCLQKEVDHLLPLRSFLVGKSAKTLLQVNLWDEEVHPFPPTETTWIEARNCVSPSSWTQTKFIWTKLCFKCCCADELLMIGESSTTWARTPISLTCWCLSFQKTKRTVCETSPSLGGWNVVIQRRHISQHDYTHALAPRGFHGCLPSDPKTSPGKPEIHESRFANQNSH